MIVSHRHKFIYLRTEKTASTSLTRALMGLLGPEDEVFTTFKGGWTKFLPVSLGGLKRVAPQVFGLHFHAKANHVRQILGRSVFDSYLKFAVERNPWERQVSLYNHRQARKGRPGAANFDRDICSPIYRALHLSRLQNWEIYAIGDSVVADKVLRYENLDAELAELSDEIGLDALPVLPQANSHGPERAHYSHYYSPESRDIVGDMYHREVAAFGYQFDDQKRDVA